MPSFPCSRRIFLLFFVSIRRFPVGDRIQPSSFLYLTILVITRYDLVIFAILASNIMIDITVLPMFFFRFSILKSPLSESTIIMVLDRLALTRISLIILYKVSVVG